MLFATVVELNSEIKKAYLIKIYVMKPNVYISNMELFGQL